MARLDTPDLCAHLDRLTLLCDRLEKAQSDPARYRELVRKIRQETDALHDTICRHPAASRRLTDRIGA